jgi:hypothetical protein
MSSTAKNYKITFWNAEDTFQAPATRSKKLTLQGVQSATLNWNIQPQNGSGFDNIVFNGAIISTQTQGSADVTQYVIANGENLVVLNYREHTLTWTGLRNNVATVSLDVIATSAGQESPSTTFSLSSLPWYVWAGVAVAVLAVIAYVVLKTSAGGKLASLAYGTAKDVAKAVTD